MSTTVSQNSTVAAQTCAQFLSEILPKVEEVCGYNPIIPTPVPSGFSYRDFMEVFAWILFGLYVSSFLFYLIYCFLSGEFLKVFDLQ